jgi:flagellar biosynthesis chaperone FliJ
METTQLDPRLQKLVDLGESGTDILHGELKNMMYECEKILVPLLENSDELGSDEEYEDTVERLYNSGYMDALSSVYALTYQLAFAISDRTKKNA